MPVRPLVEALRRRPVDVPPVWVMRQAGRHLPEYRELRRRFSFHEAVSTPEVAAEITLQPVRRYRMDGAVIFADIMTPLEALGVAVTFAPGPTVTPLSVQEVAALGDLDPERLAFVADTIGRVRREIPDSCAVIGFAGAPFTLLCYLLEGGASKDFMAARAALRADPAAAADALGVLARAMAAYLRLQTGAGADVVQLFDSWAGVLGRERYVVSGARPAAAALAGLTVPTIYFAPGAGHTLDLQGGTGADAIGVDWRLPLDQAWSRIGDRAIQGNLDPAVLLADRDVVGREAVDLRRRAGDRPGFVANLGHGIDARTPPDHVQAFVDAIRGSPGPVTATPAERGEAG